MTSFVVSVGTDHHPFTRLVTWSVAAAARLGADVSIQSGATPIPEGVEAVPFMPAAELARLMAAADAVVCHGGPGTIAGAQRAGHRAIVVPRDPTLGEHVDDHQLRFAAKLAAEGSIDIATSVDELTELLRADRARLPAGSDVASRAAVDAFSVLIDELVDGTIRRRRWRDRVLIKRTNGSRST